MGSYNCAPMPPSMKWLSGSLTVVAMNVLAAYSGLLILLDSRLMVECHPFVALLTDPLSCKPLCSP
jgi:hypothetical protein